MRTIEKQNELGVIKWLLLDRFKYRVRTVGIAFDIDFDEEGIFQIYLEHRDAYGSYEVVVLLFDHSIYKLVRQPIFYKPFQGDMKIVDNHIEIDKGLKIIYDIITQQNWINYLNTNKPYLSKANNFLDKKTDTQKDSLKRKYERPKSISKAVISKKLSNQLNCHGKWEHIISLDHREVVPLTWKDDNWFYYFEIKVEEISSFPYIKIEKGKLECRNIKNLKAKIIDQHDKVDEAMALAEKAISTENNLLLNVGFDPFYEDYINNSSI